MIMYSTTREDGPVKTEVRPIRSEMVAIVALYFDRGPAQISIHLNTTAEARAIARRILSDCDDIDAKEAARVAPVSP